MHFYYLDESGCTGNDLHNDEQPIFVLGGISIRDEGWIVTHENFNRILNEYFNGHIPSEFELHSEQLLSPNGDGYFEGHNRNNRNDLAKTLLNLVCNRSHAVHLFAIDKARLSHETLSVPLPYETNSPYLISYDYLITYINWFIKTNLGRSARGMLIIDKKDQFQMNIEQITCHRRYILPVSRRVKKIVEYTYPIDSHKNPMIQLSDLVVYCTKKFLEIDNGYRESYPQEAKQFFAECYSVIHNRIRKKELVEQDGSGLNELNDFLRIIHSSPVGQWRRRYNL